MENFDLRKRVAEMMGWSNLGLGRNVGGFAVLLGDDPDTGDQRFVPQFESQDRHAIKVERWILENGSINAYWIYLNDETADSLGNGPAWLVARLATPEQRCRAALRAMSEESHG
jgi:hypothetical protein